MSKRARDSLFLSSSSSSSDAENDMDDYMEKALYAHGSSGAGADEEKDYEPMDIEIDEAAPALPLSLTLTIDDMADLLMQDAAVAAGAPNAAAYAAALTTKFPKGRAQLFAEAERLLLESPNIPALFRWTLAVAFDATVIAPGHTRSHITRVGFDKDDGGFDQQGAQLLRLAAIDGMPLHDFYALLAMAVDVYEWIVGDRDGDNYARAGEGSFPKADLAVALPLAMYWQRLLALVESETLVLPLQKYPVQPALILGGSTSQKIDSALVSFKVDGTQIPGVLVALGVKLVELRWCRMDTTGLCLRVAKDTMGRELLWDLSFVSTLALSLGATQCMQQLMNGMEARIFLTDYAAWPHERTPILTSATAAAIEARAYSAELKTYFLPDEPTVFFHWFMHFARRKSPASVAAVARIIAARPMDRANSAAYEVETTGLLVVVNRLAALWAPTLDAIVTALHGSWIGAILLPRIARVVVRRAVVMPALRFRKVRIFIGRVPHGLIIEQSALVWRDAAATVDSIASRDEHLPVHWVVERVIADGVLGHSFDEMKLTISCAANTFHVETWFALARMFTIGNDLIEQPFALAGACVLQAFECYFDWCCARGSGDVDDDDAWRQWLIENPYTPHCPALQAKPTDTVGSLLNPLLKNLGFSLNYQIWKNPGRSQWVRHFLDAFNAMGKDWGSAVPRGFLVAPLPPTQREFGNPLQIVMAHTLAYSGTYRQVQEFVALTHALAFDREREAAGCYCSFANNATPIATANMVLMLYMANKVYVPDETHFYRQLFLKCIGPTWQQQQKQEQSWPSDYFLPMLTRAEQEEEEAPIAILLFGGEKDENLDRFDSAVAVVRADITVAHAYMAARIIYWRKFALFDKSVNNVDFYLQSYHEDEDNMEKLDPATLVSEMRRRNHGGDCRIRVVDKKQQDED